MGASNAHTTRAVAKAGKDGLQKAYNQCRTHNEKRAFFYDKYLLDPEVCEKAVLKKDTQESVVTEDNLFFLVGALCLSAGHHLKFTRGPAGNRTTTGSLSATQECCHTN